jgi:hypothetical protein
MISRFKELEFIIDSIEYEIKGRSEFYSVDGRKLFQLRGQSGGVLGSAICYLIKTVGEKNYSYGIEFPALWMADPHRNRFNIHAHVLSCLEKFERKIEENTAYQFFDGGDLGRGEKPEFGK